jgi:hypothetical protein
MRKYATRRVSLDLLMTLTFNHGVPANDKRSPTFQ